ncbi:ankyrin repeat-containing domain protein [Aspergillus multicolor]|uniref:ankyrin repeat domain-containing protein n=1 Tax=Aspergillus multicolor TaxID=41759 RepID=UPI003CCD2F2B
MCIFKKESPMHIGWDTTILSTIKLLLEHGADINASDNSGQTPLSLAVEVKNAPAVSLLLTRGASPNNTDGKGRTTLLLAVASESQEMVEYSLAADYELGYIEDEDGCSPISRAVAQEDVKMVRTLTEYGKKKCSSNFSIPRRAVLGAAMNGQEEMLTLLLAPDGVDTSNYAAVLSSYAQAELQKQGANHRAPHNHGATLMWKNLYNSDSENDFDKDTDIVRAAFHTVSERKKRCHYYSRILSWAARQGDVETKRMLLERLDIGLQEAEDLVLCAEKSGHQAVVELLCERYSGR